jgi:hypothetical protein
MFASAYTWPPLTPLGEADGCAMRCLACGAEMQLSEVVLADIPTMPGFERHTFRCLACPQVARRLVNCRAKMPISDPPAPAHPGPVIQPEMGQARSAWPDAVEKLSSRQTALEEQKAQTGSQRSRSSAWPSKTEQWQRGPRLGQRRSRSSAADRWLLRSARQLRAPPPNRDPHERIMPQRSRSVASICARGVRLIRPGLAPRARAGGLGPF